MAAPSGPRSGKHGYVYTQYGETYIRNWLLNWNQALAARIHSASAGGTERVYGVEDWNGTFEAFGGNPNIFPGDEFTIGLFSGPSDGVHGTTGQYWSGDAICDSLTINWNWQPSQTINWSAAFSANGCLADTDDEKYDAGADCVASMCTLSITYQNECVAGSGGTGDEGSFTTLANVESATLTITAANQAVVNSSTACCTKRVPGNIDWTLAIVDQEEYPILAYNTYYRFRLYDTAATYWSLAFGLLQDISNIRVDRENGTLVTKTNTLAMNARACCGQNDAILGEIVDPDLVTRWPIAVV